MNIKKTRIRKISPYTRLIPPSENIHVGIVDPSPQTLKKIGFSPTITPGESILPTPVGRISFYNAEGKTLIHKDRPLETAYTTIQWSWTEWHGPYSVEKTDFRERPYKRYPRTLVPPPAIELTLHRDVKGRLVAHGPLIIDWKQNEEALLHSVNLLLEIFGECGFFDEKMEQVIKTPITKLNWRILPPGERPFAVLKKELAPILMRVKDGKKAFTEHRLETINKYGPPSTYVGMGGFMGYVVFAFPEKKIYILESILYGNATYILGENWEKLSQKTKAEILNQSLHKKRIIHSPTWAEKVAELF